MNSNDQHVTKALVNWYMFVRQALSDVVGNMSCLPGSPSSRWREELCGEPNDNAMSMLFWAERSAAQAAGAARQHLRLCARAYRTETDDAAPEDPDDWPSEAVYPPARAALEGLAVVGWLHRPDVIGMARLQRIAELMLWSAPKDWKGLIGEAGIEVDYNETGLAFVRSTGKPLTWRRLIMDTFGEDGYALYSRWSKLAHNDPKRSADLSRWTPSGNGWAVKHEIREDEHLELAADVADSVATTITRTAAYLGSAPEGPVADCRMVSERGRCHAQRAAEHVKRRFETEVPRLLRDDGFPA